jgi:cytochrome c
LNDLTVVHRDHRNERLHRVPYTPASGSNLLRHFWQRFRSLVEMSANTTIRTVSASRPAGKQLRVGTNFVVVLALTLVAGCSGSGETGEGADDAAPMANEAAANGLAERASPTVQSDASVNLSRPAAFAQCATCHSTGRGEPHRVGPNLFGIVGARAGSKAGYAYSDALKKSDIAWTRDKLHDFVASPREVVPGTKMLVAGPRDPNVRGEIIDYLASLR